MKFLFDVNLSYKWPEWLTANGIDAIHWSSVGHSNDTDDLIFQYAIQNEYIIVTSDLDFGTLLSHSKFGRPSVIQIRVDETLPSFLGPRLLSIMTQFATELNDGAIVTVLPQRNKLRRLPI
ncbi:MAG: DUF5615 family PIN-like protein [Planctomycetota bacterium]